MTIKEKLNLWVEITGVNPTEKVTSYTIRFDRLSRCDIEEMNKRLSESLETGNPVIINALLRGFLKQYADDSKLTFSDMLENKKVIMDKLALVERLHDSIIADEEETAFFQSIKNALDYYGADISMEDIDPYDVSQVFLCAKRNMASLDRIQLRRGAFSKEPQKVMKDIYLFKDVEDVVKGISRIKGNCILLCYINEEVSESSYFCFALKNGENVYIMNDSPSYAHPYQKYLSRCPSRRMESRIMKGSFPYSLTGVDLSNCYHIQDAFKNEEAEEAFLGKFKDMQLSELLFCIFIIQFIQEEFYQKEIQLTELSYTRGMLDTPLLLAQSETSLAIYSDFDKLSLTPIESFEQTNDLVFDRESSFGTDDYYFKYLVERFGNKIDVAELQKIEDAEKNTFSLTDKMLPSKDSSELTDCHKNVELLSFGENIIGTKEELDNLRKWQLRYNYAKMMDAMAETEYKESRNKVKDWVSHMAHENWERIIDMALKEELKAESITFRNGCVLSIVKPNEGEKDISLTHKMMLSKAPSGIWLFNKGVYSLSNYKCVLSKERATICLVIYPHDYRTLMQMFGITREELPVEIRTWKAGGYSFDGNYILDNIDPMEWAIHDFWQDEIFTIVIPLSKTAYSKKCRELQIPCDKFWLEKEKET